MGMHQQLLVERQRCLLDLRMGSLGDLGRGLVEIAQFLLVLLVEVRRIGQQKGFHQHQHQPQKDSAVVASSGVAVVRHPPVQLELVLYQ